MESSSKTKRSPKARPVYEEERRLKANDDILALAQRRINKEMELAEMSRRDKCRLSLQRLLIHDGGEVPYKELKRRTYFFKWATFLTAILSMFVGYPLLAKGVWGALRYGLPHTYQDLATTLVTESRIMCICGALLIYVTWVLAMCGAVREDRRCIGCFGLCMLVIMVATVTAGAVSLHKLTMTDHYNQMDRKLNKKWSDELRKIRRGHYIAGETIHHVELTTGNHGLRDYKGPTSRLCQVRREDIMRPVRKGCRNELTPYVQEHGETVSRVAIGCGVVLVIPLLASIAMLEMLTVKAQRERERKRHK